MRRGSLLFLGLSGCLAQDPAWDPPAETDAALPLTSGSSEGETGPSSDGSTGGTEGESANTGASETDDLPDDCAPLPEPPADAVLVSPADNADLHTILADAPPDTTIALAPGTYDRAGLPTLVVSTAGITVRSTTGDPSDVVLDGGATGVTTLLTVQADDVLLAEFTLQGSDGALVDVGVEDEILRGSRIYRMIMRDAGGAKLDVGPGLTRWTDDGVVACSTFEQSDAFRDTRTSCSGLSAVQISGGARWRVRDNLIAGHWCSSSSYAALVADRGSRDTRVERNVMENNFRGILLGGDEADGRPEPAGDTCGAPAGATWGHVRGVVVNNVTRVDDPRIAGAIVGSSTDLDSMLGFWHVCGAVAVHNTSYVTLTTFNGIEWRYPDTSVTIANNLISTTLVSRDGGVALGIEHNATGIGAAEFVDAPAGDLRLAAGSIARDAGIVVPAVGVPEDFDRNQRSGIPDLGAFESQP